MLEVKPGPTPAAAEPVPVPAEGLSIAAAARRTGLSVHTLRYYERAGLVVTAVDRTAGGRRRYHRLDLDWITVCTRLRATGMPIRTIRDEGLSWGSSPTAGHPVGRSAAPDSSPIAPL